MQVFGIVGWAGSGKDTVANYLVQDHNFRQVSFAAPLKDAVAKIFHWPRNLLEGDTKESREWRETVDNWWSKRLDIPNFTPRKALQLWGTDVGRRAFHDDIWIASLEYFLDGQPGSRFVVSDCRFPNEIKMIESLGGATIRIHRGPAPEWSKIEYEDINDLRRHMSKYEPSVHASEYEWTLHKHKFEIDNNGTLDDLRDRVSVIVES